MKTGLAFPFAAVSLILVAIVATSPAWADIQMHTANANPGNQFWGSVGLQFDVLSPISVLQLGVYDSGRDFIQETTPGAVTLSTVLFDPSQAVLAQIDFTKLSPGTHDATNDYLFKPLTTPLTLTPGRYTICAYGFNIENANAEHNTTLGGAGDTFHGGGLITFHDSVWGGANDTPPTFPTNTWNTHLDYFSGPNMMFTPAPGAVLLGAMGLGLVGWIQRRRKGEER